MKLVAPTSLLVSLLSGAAVAHQHHGAHHDHHRHHSHGDHVGARPLAPAATIGNDNSNNNNEEPEMLPYTHVAYHHVQQACQADVERLCRRASSSFPQAPFLRMNGAPHMTMPFPPPPPVAPFLLQDDPFTPMEMMMRMDAMMDHAIHAHQTIVMTTGSGAGGGGSGGDSVANENENDSSIASASLTRVTIIGRYEPQPCHNNDDDDDAAVDMLVNYIMTMMLLESPPLPPSQARADGTVRSAATPEPALPKMTSSGDEEGHDVTPVAATEEMPQLAQQLQDYGSKILLDSGAGAGADSARSGASEDGEDMKVRVARRLSEVTEAHLHHLRNSLRFPFTEDERMCLKRNFSSLSKDCSKSIRIFQKTAHDELNFLHDRYQFTKLLSVYLSAVMVLIVCIVIRRQQRSSQRFMKFRVLQAVYDNPMLKKSVENELGVPSVGKNPLERKALDGAKPRCCYRFKVFLMALLFILVVSAPSCVLPLCITIVCMKIIRVLKAIVSHGDDEDNNNDDDNDNKMPTDDTQDCACCCCGGVSPDSPLLLQGIAKVADECCECCKGTGVCSSECSQCCCCCSCNGGKTAPGSSEGCCGNDCCCDSSCCCGSSCCSPPDQEKEGPILKEAEPEVAIYQGIPLQIV